MSAALRFACTVTVLLGIPAALSAQRSATFDPVRADPPPDPSAPPGMYALPADHSFSGARLALADAVVRWLSSSCAP